MVIHLLHELKLFLIIYIILGFFFPLEKKDRIQLVIGKFSAGMDPVGMIPHNIQNS